jgi:hypothetical protein
MKAKDERGFSAAHPGAPWNKKVNFHRYVLSYVCKFTYVTNCIANSRSSWINILS